MSVAEQKVTHLLHCPFTGLGLYNGFRGNRWLKNRIQIFKQFVVPSLLAQTNQDFILWVAWRHEERKNKQVLALKQYLDEVGLKSVFTYHGIAFWDDKYPDDVARLRLVDALHGSMASLVDVITEDTVLLTIQPSDDCYWNGMIEEVQALFDLRENVQCVGYKEGYVMDYMTGRLAEWNPKTTPPFYTIKFDKKIFIDPLSHLKYIGPYKSHEYVKDYLKSAYFDRRGFIVGVHGDNISTIFNHPYTGLEIYFTKHKNNKFDSILSSFGLLASGYLEVSFSLRKRLFNKTPHRVQRKLRYWAGEKQWILRPFFAWLYNAIRS